AANTDFSEPVHVELPGENSGKESDDADAASISGRSRGDQGTLAALPVNVCDCVLLVVPESFSASGCSFTAASFAKATRVTASSGRWPADTASRFGGAGGCRSDPWDSDEDEGPAIDGAPLLDTTCATRPAVASTRI